MLLQHLVKEISSNYRINFKMKCFPSQEILNKKVLSDFRQSMIKGRLGRVVNRRINIKHYFVNTLITLVYQIFYTEISA